MKKLRGVKLELAKSLILLVVTGVFGVAALALYGQLAYGDPSCGFKLCVEAK